MKEYLKKHEDLIVLILCVFVLIPDFDNIYVNLVFRLVGVFLSIFIIKYFIFDKNKD